MKKNNIPFVNLHGHSGVGSPFDGLGNPSEHMDFAFENGSSALALTDHGNMNGLAHQVLHAKRMKEEGKDFKPIYGVEAYFIPSVSTWKEEYERAKADKKEQKKLDHSKSATTIEDEASKRKTRSIINQRRHLILLAQSQEGLNNIFKLVSKSFSGDNFYRYPRLDYNALKEHSSGVIAASACLGGVYAGNYWENREHGEDAIMKAMRETTRNMIEIFDDRWYGELQWNNIIEQHHLNKYIIQLHHEFGIPLVSTADSHYPNRDAWKDRELYKRLGWLGKGRMPDWMPSELPAGVEEIGYELYPKNGNEMWDAYKHYSEKLGMDYKNEDAIRQSIENTYDIAFNKIETFTPDNTVRLPSFVVPPGQTADHTLVAYCADGLRQLNLHKDKEYLERLKEELDVIADRGFSKYFLTMNAIANKANKIQLTGPGRGSAAGSLVAYALGITQVDPIKYNLLFSRFLRRDAQDYPDIDYDVSDPMELKELLAEEWGTNTVVPISNFNTLQLRSLIKDISKLYDIPFAEVNKVTSKMLKEATPIAKKIHGIKAGVYAPTFDEVMEYSDSLKSFLIKYPHIGTHVKALYGEVRSVSRHAGGVVVGEDLNKHMPLINSGGITQTPWSEGQSVRHLEPMGFIKFDILGLSTLKMIECAIGHILKRHHNVDNPTFEDIQEYYDNKLHPDKLNLKDQQVYDNIFHTGRWAGIFQFTENGAQSFCVRAKPRNIINIAAITSIYRPGPLSANVHELYVEAKESPGKIRYGNEIVKEVTKETYGFLIFQEQIALLAHRLGKNISLDEGNKLRKLLTKKGTGAVAKQKQAIKLKFVEGCLEKEVTKEQAEHLWQKFEYFSGYGFNKSHAVSYSIISYQCAWLFNYYPAEWMAAYLDKEPESRKEKAINIAKKFGFLIKPVDVNLSGIVWDINDTRTLVQPLTSLKGLGEKAIEQILAHRPFKTIEEFIFHDEIVYSKLNKKAVNVLAKAKALNELMDERFNNLKHFWEAIANNRPKSKKKLLENIEEYKDTVDFTRQEMISDLVDITGIYPMHLVLDDGIKKRLEYYKVPPMSEYDKDLGVVWLVPREIIQKKTIKGRPYYIVRTLDINSEQVDIKCWGIRPDKDKIYVDRPYMVKVTHQEQWGFSTRQGLMNWKLLG